MRYGKVLWVLGLLPLASANPPQYMNGSSRGKPYAVEAATSKQYHYPTPGCRDCCTSTLLATTYHTTFYETETIRITVTQHDVSTKLEYTTDFVTRTTISTFKTSFPVTVTTTKNCVPESVNGARPTPVKNGGYGNESPSVGDSQYCDTITTTEWKTTTATDAFTVVQPSVTTKTVLVPTISVVPTTVEDTRTVTQVQTSLKTIWLSTTYTELTTYSREHIVTVTSGQTVIATTTSTERITTVSTLTSSYPVVTEVTKLVTQTATVTAPGEATTATVTEPGEAKTATVTAPGEATTATVTEPGEATTATVTAPGEATTATVTEPGEATTATVTAPGEATTATVTAPGEATTATVTAPGQVTTLTLPAVTRTLPEQTVTLPGSTAITTLTRELPATTITVTEKGQTFISTLSGGETVTVTQDGRTFTATRPGETRTLPASTVVATITQVLPGQTITVTQGGSTLIRTLLGETVVSTVTEELPSKTVTPTQGGATFTTSLPGQTVTLTESGKTLMTTLRGKTVTVTQDATTIRTTLPGTTAVISTTIVLAPSGVPSPSGTTVTKTVQEISVCPSPTGSSAPLSPDSNLTFGCKPGYVCNPPKPNGCNVWPGPPSDDFLCRPQDCIPSPPFQNVTWEEGETSYYPLSEGYFQLNPEAFGLSYDIFTFKAYEEVEYGHTRTITTGNWESQASLSDWPRTTATSARANVYSLPPPSSRRSRRALDRLSKRATTPSVCFDECNNGWTIGARVGKRDELCNEGSSFRNSYNRCSKCITSNSHATKDVIREYVEPEFKQFIDWCSGHEAKSIKSTTAAAAESVVSAQPSLRIVGDVDGSWDDEDKSCCHVGGIKCRRGEDFRDGRDGRDQV
ncbi:hypothetical protein G6O67_000574 [Ophiocordyceps sinensis]|uniref:Glycoprotein X n=1 Tax=Ophiocordyceps sinensis TaxID=72228 RepID=A0A8H4PZP8_9HYPO|nr:hypothetical protein G6O67_000574 [Ophiocordyceps sinensis]